MNYKNAYIEQLILLVICSIFMFVTTLLFSTKAYSQATQQESKSSQAVSSSSANSESELGKTDFQKRMTNKTNSNNSTESQVGSNLITGEDLTLKFIKGIAYCIAIAMLLFIANAHFKNKKDSFGSNPINILSRKVIGNRASLMLVEVDGKKFFLSQNIDTVQLIAPLSDPLTFSDELNSDSYASQKNIIDDATHTNNAHDDTEHE